MQKNVKKVCEIFGSSKKVATFASAFEKNTILRSAGLETSGLKNAEYRLRRNFEYGVKKMQKFLKKYLVVSKKGFTFAPTHVKEK